MSLITRECACGCGLTFRVMPDSSQQHAGADHFTDMAKHCWRKAKGTGRPRLVSGPGEVTIRELQAIVGVSNPTLRGYIKAGVIVPLNAGGYGRGFLFSKSQAVAAIEAYWAGSTRRGKQASSGRER